MTAFSMMDYRFKLARADGESVENTAIVDGVTYLPDSCLDTSGNGPCHQLITTHSDFFNHTKYVQVIFD